VNAIKRFLSDPFARRMIALDLGLIVVLGWPPSPTTLVTIPALAATSANIAVTFWLTR